MGVRERITASLTDIRTRGQKLVELNVELLKAELKRKAQEYGGAIGMLVAAGLLSLYALGFLLATVAVVLALWLPTWLALLIVTLVLFLIIAILILAGRNKLQKLQAAPPPQAPAEAKITIATVRDGAARTAKSLRPAKRPAPGAVPMPASGTDRPGTPEASAARAPGIPGAPAPDVAQPAPPKVAEWPAPGVPETPQPGEKPPATPPTEPRT